MMPVDMQISSKGALTKASRGSKDRAAHAPGHGVTNDAAEDLIGAETTGQDKRNCYWQLVKVQDDKQQCGDHVANRHERNDGLCNLHNTLRATDDNYTVQPGDDQACSPRLNAKSLVCRRSNVVGLHAWEDKAVADERGQRDDERKPPWFQTIFDVVGHAAAVFAVHAALVQLHQNRLGICTGRAEQPGNRHSHDGTRATHGDSGGDTDNTVDSNARGQGQSKGLEW